ncbi:Uncharacterised protein [Vibrio cholerae]|nr:Uncharacterised protein [Vibrio cholerae]
MTNPRCACTKIKEAFFPELFEFWHGKFTFVGFLTLVIK